MTELQRMIGTSYKGATFRLEQWLKHSDEWTHDHCEMCNAQLREDAVVGDYREGYVTYEPANPSEPLIGAQCRFVAAPLQDGCTAHWICSPCFNALKEAFDWSVAENSK